MGVDSKRPEYSDHIGEWTLMRDAARGEKAIKEAGEKYLPMPSGFRAQQDGGVKYYEAYQCRAQFPSILPMTVGGMVGVIHRVEAKIDMPEAMQPLWEKATADGLPLEAFHRRITAELLTTGRYSILADAASEGSELPWLAGYGAEALINWSDARDLFVLDETGPVRNEFEWTTKQKYRVLDLVEGRYRVRTFTGTTDDLAPAEPTARGNKPLTEIPFVVIGATDVSLDPEDPPLLGVARSSVALYQLSADYRWQMFMSGQETATVINGDAPDAVGAGVVLVLKGTPGMEPDFKYVGPSGTGIAAHRQAILDERDNAVAAGARLFDNTQKSAESGEALRLRYTAQTATLTTISQASAAGLERALRYIAIMIGADPDAVVVTPNLQFIDQKMTPQDALNLVKVWQAGGISQLTLFENFQRGEIVTAERSFEEEKEEIAKDQEGMEPEQQIDPVTGNEIEQPEAA
jgi:hypothetical protein